MAVTTLTPPATRPRTLAKRVRYQRAFSLSEMTGGKAETGNGWVEGYASTFGNIDKYGEVVEQGAFTKSIQERIPGLPFMSVHVVDGGTVWDIIGTVTEAREDEHGLWIHAEFNDTEEAQAVRAAILDGRMSQMSVGYELIRWENDRSNPSMILQRLRELKLTDIIATATPVNEEAIITAAKAVVDNVQAASTDDSRPHLSEERIRGLSRAMLDAGKSLEGVLNTSEPPGTARAAAMRMRTGVKRRRLQLNQVGWDNEDTKGNAR